jgi:hypothetical protein
VHEEIFDFGCQLPLAWKWVLRELPLDMREGWLMGRVSHRPWCPRYHPRQENAGLHPDTYSEVEAWPGE